MLRFLATAVLTLLGNAIGLLAASWLIQGFELSAVGFVWSVVFFTVAQIILAPFIFKMAVDYLPALRGGVALATILVVLVLTSIFTGGLSISGVVSWILAPLVIWLVTLLAGIVLPLFLFKKTLGNIKENRQSKGE
ncbi:MAG: phage holin family protein [Candidatus Saccharimonadota bacterium]|jgi:hypothetical protein